jgi:hypothetical protein
MVAGLFHSVGKGGQARDVLGPCLSPFADVTRQDRGNGDEDSASQSPFPLS